MFSKLPHLKDCKLVSVWESIFTDLEEALKRFLKNKNKENRIISEETIFLSGEILTEN